MGIGDNIKILREKQGLTQQNIADIAGVTNKAVSAWENGLKEPRMGAIEKIAAYFGIKKSSLIEDLENENIKTYSPNLISLPVVGRISCGNGALAYEEIEGYEPTPETWLNGGEYFYLRAKGDSMKNARIQEGDLVLIRQQDDVEDGEIAAVLINDQAVLKKVYKRNGTLWLQSENPDYPPIICDAKGDYNVKILGKLKRTVITY
ncbi:XRE family transcriptional regulator [Dehalobacter restrictus]|uniref:LexA family protein n=1 Tax=Dehalobacter restrictus TaxID=55583 RepID=UPI00338D578C